MVSVDKRFFIKQNDLLHILLKLHQKEQIKTQCKRKLILQEGKRTDKVAGKPKNLEFAEIEKNKIVKDNMFFMNLGWCKYNI